MRLRVPTALGMLALRVTFRRALHLVLGAVVSVPYVLLGLAFVRMYGDPDVPVAAVSILLCVALVVGFLPAFLPITRVLEIIAARGLLAVDLPVPQAGPGSRWRTAVWFAVHLSLGATATMAVLYAVPVAVGLVFEDPTGTPFEGLTRPWTIAVAVVLPLLAAYMVAGLGAVEARLATPLLGPSAAERIALLEERAKRAAERNRLARELHDSIGHALTITTLHAAAADRLLDTDPAQARDALRTIEQSGRSALTELDHVLGVLRAESSKPEPPPTLDDIAGLLDEFRAAGLVVQAKIDIDDIVLQPVVSREAFRVVQECLTNALRHAGQVPVELSVTTRGDGVEVKVSNPFPVDRDAPSARVGRGILGIRERVTALGGRISVGPASDAWKVDAFLPSRRGLEAR